MKKYQDAVENQAARANGAATFEVAKAASNKTLPQEKADAVGIADDAVDTFDTRDTADDDTVAVAESTSSGLAENDAEHVRNNPARAYEHIPFDSEVFLDNKTTVPNADGSASISGSATYDADAKDEIAATATPKASFAEKSPFAEGEFDLATKKLIILRIVERLPDLTDQDLLQLTLDSLYLDYFTFSTCFADLQHDGLITSSLRKLEFEQNAEDKQVKRLEITEKGVQVLRSLDKSLPRPVRYFIDQLYIKHCAQLQAEAEQLRYLATYKEQGAGYRLELSCYRHKELTFRLEMLCLTEQEAETIKSGWENNGDLYRRRISDILNRK